MNKSESKYFNTAARMDKAFLELLEKKDFEYITVKEICEKAGVNRSTFYLHYDTVADLLSESTQYAFDIFQGYFNNNSNDFFEKLRDCPIEELFLITPKYLTPYLNCIKENKRLFKTFIEKAAVFQADEIYDSLFINVFTPILERFNVPETNRRFIMEFYIHGLMGIITAWLKNDCKEPTESIISVIQRCIIPDKKLPNLLR
ncbi:MAG: TetR/AcrR family transcriptional regulator [Acutalibacteraceae bacterium]